MAEHIGPEDSGAIAQLMHLLSDATRVRLLTLLGGEELNVKHLCELLDAPQPTVSHHLGILRMAGVVIARRQGKEIYYRLTKSAPIPGQISVSHGGVTVSVVKP